MQHPNVAAKRPKMLPWEYTDAPWSVWIDASFQVRSALLVNDLFSATTASPVAQFRHPWRNCIYDEAAASKALGKYEGHPIEQMMAAYRSWGHPEHWGLWATGLIAREHDDERVRLLGHRWLQTCQEWSFQDQLSEAVHLKILGLRPTELTGDHLANPWVLYQGSSSH